MTEVERLRAALERIRVAAHEVPLNEVYVALGFIRDHAEEALAPPQPTPDTRPALTPRQAEVLDYIRESIASRGRAPTVREIGRHFGIASPNGTRYHLLALRRYGYLIWDERLSRTLSVVEAS